jgi:hypothetical protein
LARSNPPARSTSRRGPALARAEPIWAQSAPPPDSWACAPGTHRGPRPYIAGDRTAACPSTAPPSPAPTRRRRPPLSPPPAGFWPPPSVSHAGKLLLATLSSSSSNSAAHPSR